MSKSTEINYSTTNKSKLSQEVNKLLNDKSSLLTGIDKLESNHSQLSQEFNKLSNDKINLLT
jgi:t-SNARE complex subunit (syntaxin)